MFNIYINDYYFKIQNQWTVLQACVLNNIDIPRFCYHEKLLIAGNCRMCLIEEMKQLKPVVSCSILINDNIFLYTNTLKVKKARESVMEFLLINHPLDCPICDQGGECDLQDQAMIFGSDKGRFYEYKRAVENKDCGVFVKTIMNRCIHCTRCVRFVNEYVDKSLGSTGRGSRMEIGFYINKIINTEILGNIIDLCPVGALTSKPYSFLARPWELKNIYSIDIFDSFNSNIRIDLRGSNILRILPKINDSLNEEWITDKIRFCYDGLRLQRLTNPVININFKFLKVNWENILILIKNNFYKLLKNIHLYKYKFLILKNFFGDFLDIESLIILKLFSNKFNFDHNLIKLTNDFLKDFTFNLKFNEFLLLNNCIFININLRISLPNLNLKFKNLYNKKDINFFYLGFYCNILYYIQNIGININILLNIIEGLHWICNKIFLNKKNTFIFYNSNINCLFMDNLNFKFINIEKILLNAIDYNINLINYNKKKNNIYLNNNYIYYNFGYNEQQMLYNFNNLNIYQGFIGDLNTLNSNIILPSTSFIEKNTSYFNFMGLYQKVTLILSKIGKSKDDWQIVKILSFFLGFKINIEFSDFLKIYYNDYFLFFKNLYIVKKKKYYNNANTIFNNLFFSYQNYYYNDTITKVSKNLTLQHNLLKSTLNFIKKYSKNVIDLNPDHYYQNYLNPTSADHYQNYINPTNANYYQNYINPTNSDHYQSYINPTNSDHYQSYIKPLDSEQNLQFVNNNENDIYLEQKIINIENIEELKIEDLSFFKNIKINKWNIELIKKKIPIHWFYKITGLNIFVFDYDKYINFLDNICLNSSTVYDYVFKWYPDNIKNWGYPIHGGRAHPWVKPEVTKMWDDYKKEHGKKARVPDEIQKQVMWCDPEKFGNFKVLNALEDEFINVFHEGSENVRRARKYLRAWTYKDRPTRIPIDKVYYIGPTEALHVKVIYFIHDKSKNLIKNMIHGNVESSKIFFKKYESFLGIEFNDEVEFNKGVSYDMELSWVPIQHDELF